MPPVWLDFQCPPPGYHWPGRLLLAAGLLTGSLLLGRFAALGSALEAAERTLAQLQRAVARQEAAAAEGRAGAAAPQAPSAARWERLFAALEGAADEGVTLLALAPGAGAVTLGGEARDIGAVLDYAQRLQSAAVLGEVQLVRHEVVADSPYRPLRFTLRADWLAGPGVPP